MLWVRPPRTWLTVKINGGFAPLRELFQGIDREHWFDFQIFCGCAFDEPRANMNWIRPSERNKGEESAAFEEEMSEAERKRILVMKGRAGDVEAEIAARRAGNSAAIAKLASLDAAAGSNGKK